ncbi:MAG: glycogen debranching protein GlgX [Blastocatellia bacterium]|nr:glycogen debranching protein GlgX [Blastocatellia bacterium]
MPTLSIGPGKCFPLGATLFDGGVNFSLYSKHATRIELLLFNHIDDAQPAQVIALDPRRNRTYHYWHVFVHGLAGGQVYGFRADGPFDLTKGHRFDAQKVLLDPYGFAVAVPPNYDRKLARRPGDNTATAMKSVVWDRRLYHWEDDAPLRQPFSATVIYEMHLKGFTAHPNSGVSPEKRGTYAGLIEKIPYLQDLGVTAVELLPVFQFDAQDCPENLVNYWGYAPASFFAPHAAYSSRTDLLGPIYEFRDMVKALHRAGIEVILDVVYNHTTEGMEAGPTLCFRGLANTTYYILEKDKARYADYSGTGNTLNANHPIVRRMILDSLRYWVQDMHVDGFRFDLASILSRDETGHPVENAPILWDIESDPVLAGTKLIAEAWDAGGLYQVGSFIGDSWKEWNGLFRDDVRGFLRAENGMVKRFGARLFGSPDLYGHEEREPEQSINFVTCHDGYTLNDLVSYEQKHNEANGEANRDGANDNRSWNCGVEGPSTDPAVEELRRRQIKNFLAINLLALGTPMLLMGDEVRRTQTGNNNAYCQDNEIGWFDWSLVEKHAALHRFVKRLIAHRLHLATGRRSDDMTLNEILHSARIEWHGTRLGQPDFKDDSHTLAVTAQDIKGKIRYHMMFNAYWEPLGFELPTLGGPDEPVPWRRWIDTALDSPEDICEWKEAPVITGSWYLVSKRSTVVLVAVT